MTHSRTEQKIRLQALQIAVAGNFTATNKKLTLEQLFQLANEILVWSHQKPSTPELTQ